MVRQFCFEIYWPLVCMGSPLLLSCLAYVFTDKTRIPNVFQLKNNTNSYLSERLFLSLEHMKKQEPPETSRWNRGSFFSWKPDLSPIYTISRDLTDPNSKREITELYLHDIYLAFLGRPMGFSYHITYSTSVFPNKLRNGFKYTDNWVKYARNLTKYVICLDVHYRPSMTSQGKTP